MTDEERASYKQWLDLYGEKPSAKAKSWWREWWDKQRESERRERESKERLDRAYEKRSELARRFGGELDAHFVEMEESVVNIASHLRLLFALVDALERRTKPP